MGKCNRGLEIWGSVLRENTLEFVSRECGVGLEGWRWLGEMNRI